MLRLKTLDPHSGSGRSPRKGPTSPNLIRLQSGAAPKIACGLNLVRRNESVISQLRSTEQINSSISHDACELHFLPRTEYVPPIGFPPRSRSKPGQKPAAAGDKPLENSTPRAKSARPDALMECNRGGHSAQECW